MKDPEKKTPIPEKKTPVPEVKGPSKNKLVYDMIAPNMSSKQVLALAGSPGNVIVADALPQLSDPALNPLLVKGMTANGVNQLFHWEDTNYNDRLVIGYQTSDMGDVSVFKAYFFVDNKQNLCLFKFYPVEKKDPLVKKDPVKPPSDLLRNSANLTANLSNPKERTVKLKGTINVTRLDKDQKVLSILKLDADMLESLTRDPDGAQMRTGFGPYTIAVEDKGQPVPFPPGTFDPIKPMAPKYTLDATSRLKKRTNTDYPATGPKELRGLILDMHSSICNLLEATMLQMPNRTMMPDETWSASMPVVLLEDGKTAEAQLMLTCKYEGTKMTPRFAGYISVTGRLRAPTDPKFKKYEGAVAGNFLFDLSDGFVSSGKLKISNEAEVTLGGDVKEAYTFDIDLTRISGNPSNIQLPAVAKDPPPPEKKTTPMPPPPPPPDPMAGKGKFLIPFTMTAITPVDPLDPTHPTAPKSKLKHHMKTFPVALQAGKTYTVTVNANVDVHLRLENGAGQVAARGNSGFQSRLTFRAPRRARIASL